MNINDLRPARDFARNFGVKAITYGGPGSGKTPTVATAPRPLMLMTEPGILTLKNSDVPTFDAFTGARITEFFEWFFNSHEATNFDTLCIDSGSQIAEIIVNEALTGKSKGGNKRHGQEAYGDMSRQCMKWFNDLYFMKEKHIYIICKQQAHEVNDSIYYRPYFPGKELNIKVPHLYDLVMRLGDYAVPSVGQVKAFRTKEQFDMMARDRSGNLAEFEPPNLDGIFKKCMA